MRISRIGQIRVYVGKLFRLFVTEKQWKNFISTMLIMLLICMVTSSDMFVYYNPTKSGSFAIICACIWVGLFNSIQSICKERAIIKREHRSGMHISSYVAAHMIYELFLCVVESLVIMVIVVVKNFDNLPAEGLLFPAVLDIYITLLLVVFSSDMMAILVSCIVRKESTAMTVMPFVLIIQLVMSGMIFELDGIAEKISYLTLSRWGLNAIMAVSNNVHTVYDHVDVENVKNIGYIQQELTGCDPEIKTILVVWGLLILFSLVYAAIGTLFLERVDSDKR